MSYPVDKKAQIHSELALVTPRLACFAAALTANETASHALLKATRNQVIARASRDRGHTPLVLWAFALMHGLWAARMKAQGERQGAADPRLFLPRGSSATGSANLARLAKFIAQLPPQQRATLHLVYGERLSYDEVAEIFAVPVSTVMTRLARAHAALTQRPEQGIAASTAADAMQSTEDSLRGREWAA
jgi:DNA-directed RNA polymerase specialized sigma24 family protein